MTKNNKTITIAYKEWAQAESAVLKVDWEGGVQGIIDYGSAHGSINSEASPRFVQWNKTLDEEEERFLEWESEQESGFYDDDEDEWEPDHELDSQDMLEYLRDGIFVMPHGERMNFEEFDKNRSKIGDELQDKILVELKE